MKKLFLIFILLIQMYNSFGENKIFVYDEKGNAIEFAVIKFANSIYYTDSVGSANIVFDNCDSLEIYMLGMKPKHLFYCGGSVSVILENIIVELPTVNINPQSKKLHYFNFSKKDIQTALEAFPGVQIGYYFKSDTYTGLRISAITFFLEKCYGKRNPVRLRIFSMLNGKPYEDILLKSIVIEKPTKKCKFELKDVSIIVPESGLLIAIEILNTDGAKIEKKIVKLYIGLATNSKIPLAFVSYNQLSWKAYTFIDDISQMFDQPKLEIEF